MSTTEQTQTEQQDDGNAIITYSNRIQAHFYDLTKILCLNNKVDPVEKRSLRLIIANLPPKAKEDKKIKHILEKMESEDKLSVKEFDDMYSDAHDWVYDKILKDAFKAKPRYGNIPTMRIE